MSTSEVQQQPSVTTPPPSSTVTTEQPPSSSSDPPSTQLSITSSNNSSSASSSTTARNHLLKSFFLKIFHKSSSNNSNNGNGNGNEPLKRNQSFFDRFKRKRKNFAADEDDLSPSGASSLSLNDLPDVIEVNEEIIENSNAENSIEQSKITKNSNTTTKSKKEILKTENDYLYLCNFNSNTINIYNKYKNQEEEELTLKLKYEISDHSDDINCLFNFTNNQQQQQQSLFTGAHDNSINYYKIINNSDDDSGDDNNGLQFITKLPMDETNTIESLSNYRNQYLISGSRDKVIRLRNFDQNFEVVSRMEGHTSWIHCVYGGCDQEDQSSDSNSSEALYESHLFSAQRSTTLNDSDIYVWNIERGKIVQKLRGHEATVYKMTQIGGGGLNSQQRLLVSASQDGSVKLWDCRLPSSSESSNSSGSSSESLVGELRGHNDWVKDVKCCTFRNPYEIVSCSMDGSIKLWDIRKLSSNTTSNTTSTATTGDNTAATDSSSSPLVETLYQNEQIGFTSIHRQFANSRQWYFGSNQSAKLHLYDFNDKKFTELNLDKEITIDAIC